MATVWKQIMGWRAREWDAFLRRALLEPRTGCVLFVLGLASALLAGACNKWTEESMRVALSVCAVCLISL